MSRISGPTLQKRYGGKWIALSKGRGRVYAYSATIKGLYQELKKLEIDPVKKTVLTKVQKPRTVGAY